MNTKENANIVLLAQLNKGDKKAFDQIFKQYSKSLYYFSFSMLKNEEDAKDIVQEVFLKLWSERDKIDNTKSFKSFLFTISYNMTIDRLRKRIRDKKFRSFVEKEFDVSCLENGIMVDYDMINNKIQSAVNELPDKRQKIFRLSREGGYSNKQIAEELNIAPKTVENQITLAIKHIKSSLGKEIVPVMLFMYLFLS